MPSASLVAIAIILRTVQGQLPADPSVNMVLGMGLLFVFDRPLDMARTAVNVFGDSIGADPTWITKVAEEGLPGRPAGRQS